MTGPTSLLFHNAIDYNRPIIPKGDRIARIVGSNKYAFAAILSMMRTVNPLASAEPCTVPPPYPDCNQNSIADQCDIETGTSVDCNDNATPDECELKRDCPPLGNHFTPGHSFSVLPYCGVCDPGGGHYGTDYIIEINPNTGHSRLFLEIPYCNALNGAAVSPDGKALRVGAWGSVYQFNPQGQDVNVPGVYVGRELNPMTYDRAGNFYVTRNCCNNDERVVRYPADGGTPEVLAYADNNGVPLADAGPIGVGPDGDVYVADYQRLVRIAPDGVVSLFDTYTSPYGDTVVTFSVLVNDSGFVFVSTEAGGIFRYTAGVPYSREVFIPCTQQFCPMYESDLSPDRSKIYAPYTDLSGGYWGRSAITAIDPEDGSHEFVTYGDVAGSCGGMAVVPLRHDVNDDGKSDTADLALMIACMDGVNVGPPVPTCYAADMDSDWDVDLYDLQSFLRANSVK